MKKRMFWVLLILATMFCMLGSASAEEGGGSYDFGDPYDVWVNGEQFYTNKTRIECGNGKAVYDALNNKIYLYGAEITETYTAPDGNRYAIYGGEGDEYSCLMVNFSETSMSTISVSGTDGKGVGIYSVGDLQFAGNPASGMRILGNGQLSGIKIVGTVMFESTHVEIQGFQYGIMASKVSINEPILKIQATNYVINTTPTVADLIHFNDNPLLIMSAGMAYDGSDAGPITQITKGIATQAKYLYVFSDHRYDVYLGDKAFTSLELTRQCGNGTATFDPDTNTLTLEDATITEGDHYDSNTVYSAIFARIPLTIVLKGTNRIQHSVNTTKYIEGIEVQDDLTIKGPGSLEMDIPASMFDGDGGITMALSTTGKLSIENADITITAAGTNCYAIYANDAMVIRNSEICCKGNKAIFYKPGNTSEGESVNANLTLTIPSNWKVYVNEAETAVWDRTKTLAEYSYVRIAQPLVRYGVWVNGEQFTSKNKTIVCGEGTAAYDPDSGTLTLNEAEITKFSEVDDVRAGIYCTDEEIEQLTVNVIGTNSITLNSNAYYNESYRGISADYDLKLLGTGTLTIRIPISESLRGSGRDGIYSEGSITLESLGLFVTETDTAVFASRTVTVNPLVTTLAGKDYSIFSYGTEPVISVSDETNRISVSTQENGANAVDWTKDTRLRNYKYFKVTPVTRYNVFVNGIEFASDKTTIACGSGTAVYDPELKKVTLTNATISDFYCENTAGSGIYSTDDLTIEVIGTNRICRFDSSKTFGGTGSPDLLMIFSEKDVRITGSGTLTFESNSDYYGIYAHESITLSNLTIAFDDVPKAGIVSGKNVSLTDVKGFICGTTSAIDCSVGTLTVTVNPDDYMILHSDSVDGSNAVVCDNTTLLRNVKYIGIQPIVKYPIYVDGKQFTSAQLTIACGAGTATYDPSADTVTLKNARIFNLNSANKAAIDMGTCTNLVLNGDNIINIITQKPADTETKYGIYSTKALTISGTGSLVLTAGSNDQVTGIGVRTRGKFTVNNAKLQLQSSDYCVDCGVYNIEVNDKANVTMVGSTHAALTSGSVIFDKTKTVAYAGTSGSLSESVYYETIKNPALYRSIVLKPMEKYPVWVNGTQMTEIKLTVQCGSGTAAYKPETRTLTLNGATLGTCTKVGPYQNGIIASDESLIVDCIGNNTINLTASGLEPTSNGIYAKGNLTIRGSGTLTVNVKQNSTSSFYGARTGETLSITGLTLNIYSSGFGIMAKGITMSQAQVEISGAKQAIYATYGNFTVEDDPDTVACLAGTTTFMQDATEWDGKVPGETIRYFSVVPVEGTGIRVNGEEFTDRKHIITCGTGTAEYVESENKIVLTNAAITKGQANGYGIEMPGDMILEVNGTCTISNVSVGISWCKKLVFGTDASLKIQASSIALLCGGQNVDMGVDINAYYVYLAKNTAGTEGKLSWSSGSVASTYKFLNVYPAKKYPVWINGVQMNEKTFYLSVNGGTATYTDLLKTISLKDLELTKCNENGYVIEASGDITVVLAGNNVIRSAQKGMSGNFRFKPNEDATLLVQAEQSAYVSTKEPLWGSGSSNDDEFYMVRSDSYDGTGAAEKSGVVPATVHYFRIYPATKYGVFANNRQFNSKTLQVQCGSGTATYDPDRDCLTLTNATITGTNRFDYAVYGTADTTIGIEGTCVISVAGKGIGTCKKLTMAENAKLTVKTSQDKAVPDNDPGKLGLAYEEYSILVSSDQVGTDAAEWVNGETGEEIRYVQIQAATRYAVKIGNTSFTSKRSTVQCGSGTAVYDDAKKQLILTDAVISTSASNAVSVPSDVQLVINGACTIETTGSYGINGNNDIVMGTDATLLIRSNQNAIWPSNTLALNVSLDRYQVRVADNRYGTNAVFWRGNALNQDMGTSVKVKYIQIQPIVHYGIWVNGEEMTSRKTVIYCDEGRVTLDKNGNALIVGDGTKMTKVNSSGYIIYAMNPMTLIIDGSCEIQSERCGFRGIKTIQMRKVDPDKIPRLMIRSQKPISSGDDGISVITPGDYQVMVSGDKDGTNLKPMTTDTIGTGVRSLCIEPITHYEVYVDGFEFTSMSTKTDGAVFNPETKTLTLTDVTINSEYRAVDVIGNPNVTLKINGNCKLISKMYGIVGNVSVVLGDGASLLIQAGTGAIDMTEELTLNVTPEEYQVLASDNTAGTNCTEWQGGKPAASIRYFNIKPMEYYEVWVNGVQMNSRTLTVACGDGTAEYDAATKTLTLRNADITEIGSVDAGICVPDGVTVVIDGDCRVLSSSYGIRMGDNVIWTGSGRLYVSGIKAVANGALNLSGDLAAYDILAGTRTDGGNAKICDSNTDLSGYRFMLLEKDTTTVPVLTMTNSWYGVTIKWKAATGYSYRILRKAEGETDWTVLATQTAVGYYDKTAQNNTLYTYAIALVKKNGGVNDPGESMSGIFMAPPAIDEVANVSGGVKVSWSAVPGANGYFVYRKDTQEGTWHMIGSTQKNLSFTDTTTESGVVYYYAIKSFVKVGTETVTSASSSAKNTIYLKNNFISKLTNQYSGVLKVAFTQTPACTGYEIVYGTKADLSDGLPVPVKMAAATDKSITNLKKGTTYYVKIRAYKTMGGYTFYSNWSAVKSLTLTK